ncbi:MAG: acyl-CoA carboxylase subunit epsilon [Micrococcales bacterium]|nr:acyl-CoA carboxylase subunit epsilon [Micrococcales bacterium]
MSSEEEATPAVRIIGPATPEDVAAVVAVLAAAGGADDRPPSGRTSTWAAHDVAMRRPVGHGPGAWQATYRR